MPNVTTVRATIVSAALAATLLLAACGGRGQSPSARLNIDSSSRAPTVGIAVSLSEAIRKLSALPAPGDVDPTVFNRLKDELARQLTERGSSKIALTPPFGVANQVDDLTIVDDGEGNYSLAWGYVSLGDYDQNGTVGISDVTPIAVHYGKTVDEQDSLEDVADGSRDGTISIADITPIAVNYGVTCAGYAIEGLSSPGSWTAIDTAPLSSASGEEGRLKFSYSLASLAYVFYRVVPYDDVGVEGVRSNVFPATVPQPSSIVEVEPAEGITGEAISFSAVVEGTVPLIYAWNFGGGSSPNTSSDASPYVTLGAEGAYSASLSVSNDQGSDTFSFILTVNTAGEPPSVNAVTPVEGYTGDATTFSADISGDGPFSFEWDFGGGTTPDLSSSESPAVTLGEPGKYFASLSVSNPWGYAPLFQFSLNVYDHGGEPVTVSDVQPREGPSGCEVTFSASASGTEPLFYEWDFGAGAEPSISYWAAPTVTLGDVGTYEATVSVFNNYGPADVYEFALTVSEDTGWPVDPAHLTWLTSWYLPLPPLSSANRVFQNSQYRAYADEVLDLINAERQAAGVGPVAHDPHMEAVGVAHCRHMATAGFFGHDNPQGMSPVQRLDSINPHDYDFPGLTHGENIGAGHTTPQAVMEEWMDSTWHRYNILHAPWTHVGIGIYYNPDDSQGYKTYWATEFVQFIGDPDSHDWIDPGESPT